MSGTSQKISEINPTVITLKKFEDFLKLQRKSNGDKLTDSTVNTYLNNLRTFWNTICLISEEEDLFKYMESTLNGKKSEVLLAAFKSYLRFRGFDEKKIKEISYEKVKKPNALNSKRFLQSHILSPNEISILFRSAKDIQIKALISAFYDSACRRDEIMSARFSQMTIMKSGKDSADIVDNIHAKLNIMGKGRKQRIVYFGKTTMFLIRTLWKDEKPKVNDYIFKFIQPNGVAYKDQSHQLYKIFKKMGQTLLHRNLSPHWFRDCVFEDTEILTSNGWKFHQDISKGDKIFTLNLKSDLIELLSIDYVSRYKVINENLVHLGGERADFLITSDHKNVLNVCRAHQKKFKRFDTWDGWKLLSYDKLKKLKSKRAIKIRSSGLKIEGKSIGKSKATILGWAISDGYLSKRDKCFIIGQSYSANKYKCDLIEKALIESGLTFSKKICKPQINKFNGQICQMCYFRIWTKSCNWFFDYVNLDKTPKYSILGLCGEELECIYNSLMLADGTRFQEYTCQDKRFVDFFFALCSLINKRCKFNFGTQSITKKVIFRTYVADKNESSIRMKDITRVKKTGVVWCPSTKNGTFICRRNGRMCITGNTKATHLASEGALVQYIQGYLGHDSVDQTMEYIKLSEIMGKKAFQGYSKDVSDL